MRIRLLSDLHLEQADCSPLPGEQDVVVLAGDIDNGSKGIEWAATHFRCPIVYVPGNHEYDYDDLGTSRVQFADQQSPVQVLDNGAAIIDGVRFLGTTLRTDFALYGNVAKAIDAAWRTISDHVRTRLGWRAADAIANA